MTNDLEPKNLAGIRRQSTEDLLDDMKSADLHHKISRQWLLPANLLNTESPQQLCRQIGTEIKLLELEEDDFDFRKRLWSAEELRRFIEDARQQMERLVTNSFREQTRKFFYGLSECSERIIGVLTAVLDGSEYAVALQLVALVFKCVNTRVAVEAKMEDQVVRIARLIPSIVFQEQALPTEDMRATVASLCSEILKFLKELLLYCRKHSIRKLMMALVPNAASKFDDHAVAIERHVQMIEELRQMASLALQLEAKTSLDNASRLLVHMYRSSQVEKAALRVCSQATLKQMRFQSVLQAQSLQATLLPEAIGHDDATAYIEFEKSRLVPAELWENHATEINITAWLQGSRRPLLWIWGPPRLKRISWVSPFSFDLVAALSKETGILSTSVFCDDGSTEFWTPARLFKYWIYGLLRNHPMIAVDLAEVMPIARLQNLGRSPDKARKLLDDVLSALGRHPDWAHQEVFLLVDRIDKCSSTPDFLFEDALLPAIQELNGKHEKVHIIVTSGWSAYDFEFLDCAESKLTMIYLDVSEGGRMRLR